MISEVTSTAALMLALVPGANKMKKEKKLFWKLNFSLTNFFLFFLLFLLYSLDKNYFLGYCFLFLVILVFNYFNLYISYVNDNCIKIYRPLRIFQRKIIIPFEDVIQVKINLNILTPIDIFIYFKNRDKKEKKISIVLGNYYYLRKIINVLNDKNCYIFFNKGEVKNMNFPQWLNTYAK